MAKKRKLESTGADRSELRRLLQAAKADHWDDGPRLAIADWLEEHGGESDRARAEVIRLQLDSDGGGPHWGVRVEKMRKKWIGEWIGPHRVAFKKLPVCERGLLAADIAGDAWGGEAELDEAWEWMETVRLAGNLPGRLLESARMSTVAFFDAAGAGVDAGLGIIARAGRLTRLNLWIERGDVAKLREVLKPGLVELMLALGRSGMLDWAGFAEAEGLSTLRRLTIDYGWLGDAGAAELAASPHLRSLHSLRFQGDGMTGRGWEALARLNLQRLEVIEGCPTGSGWESLQELSVWWGDVRKSPYFPRLRRLRVMGGEPSPAILKGLDLSHLDLFETNNVEECHEFVEALVKRKGEGPRSLSLEGCGLREESVAMLAAWPGLARVRFLDLGECGIGDDAVHTLAASPHIGSLEALDVSGTTLVTTPGVNALLRSPLAERLRWLSLSVGSAAMVKALASRPLPALRQLKLGTTGGTEAVKREIAALRRVLPDCAIG